MTRHLLLWLVASPIILAQELTFDSNGVPIRYIDEGRGEPIVLLHGFLNNLDRNWVVPGVVKTLARNHRVIAIDWRGHGKSGKPHDPTQYGPQMGRDVIALLDHLGVRKAHLVGYSMGGDIAAWLVIKYPERFASVTLGASSGFRNWTAERDRATEALAAEIDKGSLRSMILLTMPPTSPVPTDEEIVTQSRAALAGQDQVALAAVARGFRNTAVSDSDMAAVSVPMLAIIGSADARLTGLKELIGILSGLKTVVIEGATHYGTDAAYGKPEFTQAIDDFVTKLGGNSAR